MSQYGRWPSFGSPSWKSPVAVAASLPLIGNIVGDTRVSTDTDTIYVWDGSSWIAVATPGAAIAIDGLIGDVTASGPGVVAATLATVNGNVGTFGSTSQSVQVTVNAKGLVTAISNQTIPGPIAPTVQKFLSGLGTYTTPVSPAPLYIRVRMIGGGAGGGGGDVSGSFVEGGLGGDTTFGTSLLVAGGAPGIDGGTASLGTGPVGIAAPGGAGGPAFNSGGTSNAGSSGAASPFGGNGSGVMDTAGNAGDGSAAAANSGSGGGGGGSNSQITFSGPGGGAGGYIDAIIYNPDAVYAYEVGIGGTGTAGGAIFGGSGGSGIVVVEEYYQ